MGIMIFGNATGGGFSFPDVRRGDKYAPSLASACTHT
jgi:hypothetical protein